jgi:hypothetical protein
MIPHNVVAKIIGLTKYPLTEYQIFATNTETDKT